MIIITLVQVLFDDLRQHGILATGTFRTNRQGLPSEVVSLKDALLKVPRGTGYYIRDSETDIVYCVWKDTRVVSVMSTCHPGHQSPNLVSRNCLDADGKRTTMEIPRPIAIESIINIWVV